MRLNDERAVEAERASRGHDSWPPSRSRVSRRAKSLTVDEVLAELRLAADPGRIESLERAGAASPALGVALPSLRSIARRIGHDHRLALALWHTRIREARILASLIDEPERVTADQMDRWAESFDNWEICDQVCQNLFARTPLALAKAVEWTRRSEEFVKRAAFVLIAVRAARDRRAADGVFAELLPTVMAAAADDRPYVRKGASWALRQIGKRSDRLRAQVLDTVASGVDSDSPDARWVARDVTRELRNAGDPLTGEGCA